jgi:hypothetical protein
MTDTALICMGLLSISEALQRDDGEGHSDEHVAFTEALTDHLLERDDEPTEGIEDLRDIVDTLKVARGLLLRSNPQIANKLNHLADTLAENLDDDESPNTDSSGTVPQLHGSS